jgi:hypothetical protein
MKKLVVGIMLAASLIGCSKETRFVEQDLTNIRNAIITEYQKDGMQVSNLNLIIQGPKKITGYVTVTEGAFQRTVTCEAIMAEKGYDSIWKCN